MASENMDIDEPMPQNETELLSVLSKLPFAKRTGYALQLVQNHRLLSLSLVEELLSTSLLPDTVPFPDSTGSVKLLFPQSTASKRFLQRQIGLAMAAALGPSGTHFLLAALEHPSTTGKDRVVKACAATASDAELVDVYRKLVPATRASLRTASVQAQRVDVLKSLNLWREPNAPKVLEPRLVVLERDLQVAKETDRDRVWSAVSFDFKLHRRPRDPLYVPKESGLDLVPAIFNLLEKYPPVRHSSYVTKNKETYTAFPDALKWRVYSLLVVDFPRTLRIMRATCYIKDHTGKGNDRLLFPTSFLHYKPSREFWHHLTLEDQIQHVQPFVIELMNVDNNALLTNGQLISACAILEHLRWQVVVNVADAALTLLENAQAVSKKTHRLGIINYVRYAIGVLVSRLYKVAHIERKSESQQLMEDGFAKLITRASDRILAVCRISASSDQEFVENFSKDFLLPSIASLKQYPPLVELLYNNIKGIFDVTQVSKSELSSTATEFLTAMTTKPLTIYDIPKGGIVHPYCGIKIIDNSAVLTTLLRLCPPREHMQMYRSLLSKLSRDQLDIVWTYFDDLKFVGDSIFAPGNPSWQHLQVLLQKLPRSPHARLHIIKPLFDDPRITDDISLLLFPLLDISDPESRKLLQHNTFKNKRLFEDRFVAYKVLMEATWASDSMQEYLATMSFLIPRIKNEILPDAMRIPEILSNKEASVAHPSGILLLVDRGTEDQAKELADLFLSWEKQNNEAVSPVYTISSFIRDCATHALSHFAGRPSHPFFQFGMDLFWVRAVFETGPLKAHKTYIISVRSDNRTLTDEEELMRRQFVLATNEIGLGPRGFWRISDEQALADKILSQYVKVYDEQNKSFQDSPLYAGYIQTILSLLETRWPSVTQMTEELNRCLKSLKEREGTAAEPADWSTNDDIHSMAHWIKALKQPFNGDKLTLELLPWWTEYRRLRMFSNMVSDEVDLMVEECTDPKTYKRDNTKLDVLVEKLLSIDDSAVHLPVVRNHLISSRQDLIKDCHILDNLVGLFNQISEDVVPMPVEWYFTDPRQLNPHQCQVVAQSLGQRIRSGEVSLQMQVTAAEQLVRLPTTTIVELAELLKEDINPRITEAVLMHLPNLDEPAACIQFLLAPAYLEGDLSRTVVFSVKNTLQYVHETSIPSILIPVFPSRESKRKLKVTVFKEYIRLICQYLHLEELRVFLAMLWKGWLHQDVRLALLQSVTQMLGTEQEEFAWGILSDAVSNPSLLLDDALLALLAVESQSQAKYVRTARYRLSYIPPPVAEMAVCRIPGECAERYATDVLFKLVQLRADAADSLPKVDPKELKLAQERIGILKRSSYQVLLNEFLSPFNAQLVAEYALEQLQATALLESPPFGVDLFEMYVHALNVSVSHVPACWNLLVQLVDFLANTIGSSREPTKQSRKAILLVQSMILARSFLSYVDKDGKQLPVDCATLTEPLVKHGCDHFAYIMWDRKCTLFKQRRQRLASAGQLPKELEEAQTLFAELAALCVELQIDVNQFKDATESVLSALTTPYSNHLWDLTRDIVAGKYGYVDTPWYNDVRLQLLGSRGDVFMTAYAKEFATFHAQVAADPSSFYQRNLLSFISLITKMLHEKDARAVIDMHTVIDPIIARESSSPTDAAFLEGLLYANHVKMMEFFPDWSITTIQKKLVSPKGDFSLAIKLVEFVDSLANRGAKNVKERRNELSPLAAFLVETIQRGLLPNFNLGRAVRDVEEVSVHLPLRYPYLAAAGDDSGGDIEERSSKMDLVQLHARFESWRSLHANSLLSANNDPAPIHAPHTFLSAAFKKFPLLVLVHPSLFLSFASLQFSQSDLSVSDNTRITEIVQSALEPEHGRESGDRWGWAPPLSLGLFFARSLLTETANEVADAVMEDSNAGYLVCKLAAVKLLKWWAGQFFSSAREDRALLSMSMKQDEKSVMELYDELRRLACNDSTRVIRERAFDLESAQDLLAILISKQSKTAPAYWA